MASVIHWQSEAESYDLYVQRIYGKHFKNGKILVYKLPMSPLSERNVFSRLHIMFEGILVTSALLVWGEEWCFIRTLKIIKEKAKSKQHRNNL